MIQSVSASSMVLASAPWAAPAPTYPAVLNSAAYDPNDSTKVNVSFKANQNGVVSFDLNSSVQTANDLEPTSVRAGESQTISIKVPKGWNSCIDASIVIKFNGSGCGGTKLARKTPPPPPTPIPGTIKGNVEDVKLVGCDLTEDGWPQYLSINYNLTNVPKNQTPYLFINENGGKNIAKIRITETNGYCYKTSYSDHRKNMKENTSYQACLYLIDAQGKETYLGIHCPHPFVMPKKMNYTYTFDCQWDPAMNQFHIVLSPNIHPLVDKVKIRVEPYIGPGYPSYNYNGTYQHSDSGDSKKDYYFGIPYEYSGKPYIVRVEWSNGVVRTCRVQR